MRNCVKRWFFCSWHLLAVESSLGRDKAWQVESCLVLALSLSPFLFPLFSVLVLLFLFLLFYFHTIVDFVAFLWLQRLKRLLFWRLLLYGLLACTSLRHDTTRLCHAQRPRPFLSVLVWCKICATLSFVCSLFGLLLGNRSQKKSCNTRTHTHTHRRSLKYFSAT